MYVLCHVFSIVHCQSTAILVSCFNKPFFELERSTNDLSLAKNGTVDIQKLEYSIEDLKK